MRLGPAIIISALIALGAVFSVLAAFGAATAVERASARIVAEALTREGQTWTGVETDGLQVILTGRAPSEAARFRARATAARVVDGTRVVDGMDVEAAAPPQPPQFTVEMLRNDSGLQLIGLVPTKYDRSTLMRALSGASGSVTDLLEQADYPVPRGWDMAMKYASDMLPRLERAKISVAPGEVRITAVTDSPEAKAMLEAELTRRAPDDLRLALDIAAPRPVITPYTLRFVMSPDEPPRFDACAANTQVARARILSAARKAGLDGKAVCPIGLGAPTSEWAAAAEAGIGAVEALAGGSITFSDTDVALRAPEGTSTAQFDKVAAELEAALPEIFSLTTVLPEQKDGDEEDLGPPEFIATLSPEGQVQLRGKLGDGLSRQAIESLARARFGVRDVYSATRLDADLPGNWGVRVLAGLEALEALDRGTLIVQPDAVLLRGVTSREDGRAMMARVLSERLGESANFSLSVTYEAPPEPENTLPTPQECLAQVAEIIEARKITFDPGSTAISAEAIPAISAIADVLKGCRDVEMEIEIAGHTDSQGREVMNRNLSQARADAVLDALAARRVLTGAISAVGYGEEQPIETNETEEGREANRRIEFRLISPLPEGEETGTPDAQTGAEDTAETDGDGAAGETTGAPPTDPPQKASIPADPTQETGWVFGMQISPLRPQPAPERPEGSLRPPLEEETIVLDGVSGAAEAVTEAVTKGETLEGEATEVAPEKAAPEEEATAEAAPDTEAPAPEVNTASSEAPEGAPEDATATTPDDALSGESADTQADPSVGPAPESPAAPATEAETPAESVETAPATEDLEPAGRADPSAPAQTPADAADTELPDPVDSAPDESESPPAPASQEDTPNE